MHDDQFRRLLDHLNLSWAGYYRVRKGAKKRIARHMQQCRCRSLESYLALLAEDPGLERHCRMLLTVRISRFFRDRPLWRWLQTQWLPGVLRNRRHPLTVWCAGCAGGEEVYSVRIVWEEIKRAHPGHCELRLIGTDLLADHLEACRRGVYPRSTLRDMPSPLVDRYFEQQRGGKRYAIRRDLRDAITWQQHNLLYDPPPAGRIDAIFLRNSIFTYHRPPDTLTVFNRVAAALPAGGLLVLGRKESLPDGAAGLAAYEDLPYVMFTP